MNRFTVLREVAWWEFRRYFKLKQQVIGLVTMFVVGGAVYGIGRLSGNDEARTFDVAVLADDGRLAAMDAGRVRLQASADGQDALRTALLEREIDGILVVDNGAAELTVRRRDDWVDELHAALTAVRREAVLQERGIDPAVFTEALAPAPLDVRIQERARGARPGTRLTFIVVVSFMLMTIFTAMSYIFASITGEKQIRVTEQVLSAIPAQTWIDGKILGITLVSLASMLSTVGGVILLLFGMRALGSDIPLPRSLGDPLVVVLIILFAALGLFFWLSFLGAVAAMIDDPHTSTRGTLLFVPIAATAIAFTGLGNPEGGLIRALSLVPLSAPSAMPARLLLTDVAAWEIGLALALLVGATLLLRTAAARVFRLAMLMFGKEPTWREVRRWVLSP